MMTQSVMTQAVNLLGSASGSVTSKGKQNGSSFELVIDNNLKANQNLNGNTDSKTKKVSVESQKKENSKSDAVADSNQQTTKTTKTEDTKTTAQAEGKPDNTGKADASSATQSNQVNGEEAAVDEQTLEKISTMLQAVKQTVMDLLNLSAEELNQLLSDQNLQLGDLLQPENLQQLVLASNNQSDLLAVLTDENLAGTMKQLLQAVEDIKSNSGLDISMEEVKQILDSAKASLDNGGMTGTVEEGLGKEEPQKVQLQEKNDPVSKQMDEVSDTQEHVDQKEVRIEVTKVSEERSGESQSQSDLQKNDNQELSAAEQYEVFLNNLTKASTTTQVDFNQDMMRVTELRDIANQVVERIRVTIRPEQISMELQLNPEHLGKVNLSVHSRNGVMTAQFVVENEISKEAIESQLHSLRETLNQQGIKVEAIEVTIAAYSFEQNANGQTGSEGETKKNTGGRITMEDAMSMTDTPEEVIQTEDASGIRGSRIDYTA